MLEVCGAVFVGWSSYCDELNLAVRNGFVHIGGELQPADFNIALDDLVEARLVNRDNPVIQIGYFLLVNINAQDIVTYIGKQRACYQADIP